MYLGLGKQDGKASNKVYKFNVETGKTEELKEIPGEPTRNQAVAQLLGDDIYVFSGGDKIAYTDGYKYSIKDNSWTQVADVKVGNEEISLLGANSVKLNEDEMLVIGGFNKAVYDDAVKNLNTLKDESLAEFKKEYFGRDPQDFAWNTKVLIYNSKNNEWKSIGDVPFNAPCGEALILDRDNIFSINGEIKPGIRTNKIYSGELYYVN
ncbi:cyclically-permuted mutarotase family protein [Clostridium perfringens]|nr:cyclically-permuted mutarotase family protein [Clostridium perfringens]MDK0769255.1 cyclically-permuted mutarotase family protein [Clostridium perfringens]MDK0771929.1 cyclically-permuted mutarotase family protein [Clostridium perfringens]MDK0777081.1 cyclically-permuted mutarotase family protein [Clostridium perfringens]